MASVVRGPSACCIQNCAPVPLADWAAIWARMPRAAEHPTPPTHAECNIAAVTFQRHRTADQRFAPIRCDHPERLTDSRIGVVAKHRNAALGPPENFEVDCEVPETRAPSESFLRQGPIRVILVTEMLREPCVARILLRVEVRRTVTATSIMVSRRCSVQSGRATTASAQKRCSTRFVAKEWHVQ